MGNTDFLTRFEKDGREERGLPVPVSLIKVLSNGDLTAISMLKGQLPRPVSGQLLDFEYSRPRTHVRHFHLFGAPILLSILMTAEEGRCGGVKQHYIHVHKTLSLC